MITNAAEYYEQLQKLPYYLSGIHALDKLLDGGFLPGLTYHIFGNGGLFHDLLHRVAFEIASFRLHADPPNIEKIYYVDACNHFSPHLISKLAISTHQPPIPILERIQLSRAFNWNQLKEVIIESIPKVQCSTVLIDGWTNFLLDPDQLPPKQNHSNAKRIQANTDLKIFQDLNLMIEGLKSVLKHPAPLIITTGVLHPVSYYKAMGGNLLQHFAMVLIQIIETPQKIIFALNKHPFLGERRVELPIPRDLIPIRLRAKYNKIDLLHNEKLDKYLE